jgi:hypothetical protein
MDQQDGRQRDAQREVEHPHGDEPVVDHRPGEEGRHDHPAAPGEREDEPRVGEGAEGEDQAREETRGGLGPDHVADQQEPGKERGVGLEVPVEDELRIAIEVPDDRDRRQVVRQVLEGGHVHDREGPGGHDEQDGAEQQGELLVGGASEDRREPLPEPDAIELDGGTGTVRRFERRFSLQGEFVGELLHHVGAASSF